MMRYCFFLLALFGQLTLVNAQIEDSLLASKSNLKIGYSIGLSYNIYSWYHLSNTPSAFEKKTYSTGQAMNILPGLSTGLWIGNVKHWLLSLETEVTFLPFALSLQQYRGLGTLEVPTLVRFQFPLSRQQSLWTFLHFGTGIQWQLLDLYGHTSPTHSHQHFTWVGEVGWHISAVAHQRHILRELEFFVRLGTNTKEFFHFNTGLRLCFRNGNK